MKKIFLIVTTLLFLFSCSKDGSIVEQTHQTELLTRDEINEKIEKSLETTGDFIWSKQDAHTIFSAVKLGDDILTVGYGETKNEYARTEKSNTIKNELISLIRLNEPASTTSKTEELYIYENINVFDIKVTNIKTIEELLKDSRVRYIEPAGYQLSSAEGETSRPGDSGSSGCGFASMVLNSNDYRVVEPGALVPWAFDKHNIPQAWQYSTGKGITVAVIDSGLSPEQKLMNESFNDGYSSGRFVEKYGTYVDSWWSWSNNYDGVDDKCGHGTSMSALATAPRNDDNLPVGVAYNANLLVYRAVKNVVIDDYHEKRGVSEALINLADRNDVKVISISLGWPFSIEKVSDAVKYAYKKGKMILAAGGTSTSFTNWVGVIFPAKMTETVAVTGVKENATTTACEICHQGNEIDFTFQMERTNGTDHKIPVLSYYNNETDYIGGSSAATAATAGVVALIWSKYPSWSREQVLAKMKQSSEFYPNKHPDFGYGNIDVLKAVK